jgi:GNAT superfamily N-acetyltransferase
MSDADELLAVYLAPPGQIPGIGPERGRPMANGIARYVSPHGSVRYVLYRGGVALAVLQVVTRDGKVASIANVYTLPSHRRLGLAQKLLARARRDFQSVTHSEHLSESGRAWKERVQSPRRIAMSAIKSGTSLVAANFQKRSWAVWTRSWAKDPWKFHSWWSTKAEAQKASQALSYANDVRITKEGYGKSPVRGAARQKLLRIHNAVSKKLYGKSPTPENRARRILGDERYAERHRFRGWNIVPNVLHEPRLFPRVFPELTRSQHLAKAQSFTAKAEKMEKLWHAAVTRGERTFGTEGSLISGGFREHWPEANKEVIRRYAGATSLLRDAAHAHLAASKMRSIAPSPVQGTGTPYWVKIHWSDGTFVETTIRAKTLAGARRAAMHAGMRAASQTRKGKPHRITFDRVKS